MNVESEKPAKKRRIRIFPIIILLFILLIGILFYDSNTRLATTEYELRYANLPEQFDGYRIVVLSDIHATEFGRDNGRLLAKVAQARPDIIVIAGDLTDYNEKKPIEEQIAIAETLVTGLAPIAPVYYITGNHEWDRRIDGPRALLQMLEEKDVRVLRNAYALLEEGAASIILAGTDDPNGPADMTKPDEFVGRIREAEGDGFIVMLEHRNNNLELYGGLGVDLVLCGHAHGGVIRLPFTDGIIGPQRDWFPTHTSGVYSMGNTKMLVSRGLGNSWGIPRFLNNPQIVVAVLVVDS